MVGEDAGEDMQGIPSLEDIEKELSSKSEENSYLKSRNLSLQDAAESNFNPKQDSNVIEYKLSSEELLERIEHYLRGDVLKTRVNENNQTESFYATPTKKISVNMYQDSKTQRVYVVNQNGQGGEWDIVSIFESDEKGEFVETSIEINYKAPLLEELQSLMNSKAKNPRIVSMGIASKEIPDKARINLNEYGVQEVMNILSMYINKETFLSWYKEERIYEILGDLGNQLNKFFLINSKAMGLDTEYKKTKYPMIIVTILHTVENAYRRALLGNENRGTREGILVTQHQGVGQPSFSQVQEPRKKKWNPFDKTTW